MKKTTLLLTLSSVLLSSMVPLVAAQSNPSADPALPKRADAMAPSATLKRADTHFIEKAALSGMEEVIISQYALTRATNPQVKEYAQMMATDHGSANTKLAQLASSKGVMLPAKEPSAQKWSSKKEGKGFDEDYMEKMISDHNDAVDLFEKGAKSSDPDVAAFASSTLPTLKAHVAKAKDVKKALK